MSRTHVMRLLLALIMLVSVFLRPPGTMLVRNGDAITYELCTGGAMETVTIALGGDTQEKIDLGCDFFAAQIAALLSDLPDVTPSEVAVERLELPFATAEHSGKSTWRPYASRAPPVLS